MMCDFPSLPLCIVQTRLKKFALLIHDLCSLNARRPEDEQSNAAFTDASNEG